MAKKETIIELTIDDLDAIRQGETIEIGEYKIRHKDENPEVLPDLGEIRGCIVFYPGDRFTYKGKTYEAFSHWAKTCESCAFWGLSKDGKKDAPVCRKLACKRWDRSDGDNLHFREVCR